jgi:predicted dehydrogenase
MGTILTHEKYRTSPLRLGVVGVGYFGRFHARKYAAHSNCEIVGLADNDVVRVVDLAAELHCRAFTDHCALIDHVDAVSIATPATTHYRLARDFLDAGKHVLLEKPMATKLEHADELMKVADRAGVVLQPGHQERYFLRDSGLLALTEKPVRIESTRAGPFSGRGLDCSVAMDLLIHDLDMVHCVNPSPVRDVSALGKTAMSASPDEVSAALTLDDGCKVNLFASRMHTKRERSMKLHFLKGEVTVDFIARTISNSTEFQLVDVFESSQNGALAVTDPLALQVDEFIAAIVDGRQSLVNGEDARRALESVLLIEGTLASENADLERAAVA